MSQQINSAIKAGKLHGIANSVKEFAMKNGSSTITNAELLKMLINLCQFATRCDKSNATLGIDIYKITHAACSHTTKIIDAEKFFSALYHIDSSLITMKLYTEAQDVCSFLLPGSIWCKSNIDTRKKYGQLGRMWLHHINSKQLVTTNHTNQMKTLMNLMKFDLDLEILAIDENYTEFLTSLTLFYEDLKAISSEKYEQKIVDFILDSFTRANICLMGDKKHDTYNSVLRLMNIILSDAIDSRIMSPNCQDILKIINTFKPTIQSDKECYLCFKLYHEIFTAFFKPIDKLTTELAADMNLSKNNIEKVINKIGINNGAIKITFNVIVKFLNNIIKYWDIRARSNSNHRIFRALMYDFILFLNFLSDIILEFKTKTCICQLECPLKNNFYESTSLRINSLTIMQYLNDNLSNKLTNITADTVNKCVSDIIQMQENGCKSWYKFWHSCELRIYNIAAMFERIDPDVSCSIYKKLCWGLDYLIINQSSLVEESGKALNEDGIKLLSMALHRISCTMYIAEKYHQSMIAAALNAFIGYKQTGCKAFRMWANNKYKDAKVRNITIIQFLETNAIEFESFLVKKITPEILDELDKDLICLLEIRGLQLLSSQMSSSIIAVLDFMDSIDSSPIYYIQGVLLLGYHLLNFQTNITIKKYINKAKLCLKRMESNTSSYQLLNAHLKFYNFIEKLREISSSTEQDMLNAKIKLYADKKSDLTDPAMTVIPAYNLININTSADISTKLQIVLGIFIDCFNMNNLNLNENHSYIDINMSLRIIKLIAEYARFHRFKEIEIEAWKLAYNLAKKIQDHQAMIYITGRSIMAHYVNKKWIDQALISMNKLRSQSSTSKEETECIAMFELSLSNYYFHIGKTAEAKELLDGVIPTLEFTKNLPTFLISSDVLVAFGLNYEKENTVRKYIETLIKGLYTVLMIEESMPTVYVTREISLYQLDQLLHFSNHISLRMNQLIAFREISAHLVRRLSTAQKLGSTLHVAECLKNLCFIDLSRNQLDDCEVKLQGLEHILKIETFEASMKSQRLPTINNHSQQVSPSRMVEPIRDVFQNNASPVLPSKVFVSPDFIEHKENCKCFKCKCSTYKYLVFSCTHIRAQLYASQHQIENALEHFYGAFQIIRSLFNFSTDSSTCSPEDGYESGQGYYHVVEYVLFLLDIYRFFINLLDIDNKNVIDIVLHAIEICEKFKITNHPVYLNAKEIVLEYQFDSIFDDDVFATFVVPSIKSYDIDYIESPIIEVQNCTTPKRKVDIPKPASRRKKGGLILSLDDAFIDTVEDVDDRIKLAPLIDNKPKIETTKKKPERIKPIRRKISESEYRESTSPPGSPLAPSHSTTNIKPRTRNRTSTRKTTVAETSSALVNSNNQVYDDADDVPIKRTSLRLKLSAQASDGSSKQASDKTAKDDMSVNNRNYDDMVDMLNGMQVSESTVVKKSDNRLKSSHSTKSLNKKSSSSRSAVTSSTTVQKRSSGRLKKVNESDSENEIIDASYL